MKAFLSMLGLLVILASWMLAVSQADPPTEGRMVCERFANDRYRANDPANFEKILLLPQDVTEEKLGGKVGSQYVSTVVSGSGLLKLKNRAPLDIQYTCLLEDEQKTVFFHANPNKWPDAVSSCVAQAPTIGEAIPCLQQTLKREEDKLASMEASSRQKAAVMDKQWKNTKASQSLSMSEAQWKKYRDMECVRRNEARAGGNHPDITEYECRITKTRERIQDLSFNQ